MLPALGFSRKDIEAANVHICGAMTLEGAPFLKDEHLPVFDCANPVRQDRQALPLGRKPHPHDGGGPALHLGRDLQDHQHAERRHRRGLQERLHAVLEAGAEGQRALPRRLETVAAAQRLADRRRRRGRGRCRRGADRRTRRCRAPSRSPKRSSSASSSGSTATAKSCRTAARATPRRRSSAATRSICAPASSTTAASARSSSTCTRKAPPSAR